MAIMLSQLCEKSNYLYGMRVLAGENGMNKIVQWVHTIEDEEASEFLHGGELIFTTGIAQKTSDWLFSFIKKLSEKDAAGLVVNYGPYINEVPQDIQDYCNKINFTLLEVPWKTRLVDITRDFCNQIIQNEKEEEDIGETLKNIIFYPGEAEKYTAILERHNFTRQKKYCIVAVHLEANNQYKNYIGFIKLEIERRLYHIKEQIGYFEMGETIFFVLGDYETEEIEASIHQIYKMIIQDKRINHIYIAVGSNDSTLESLYKNYHKTISILQIAIKNGEGPLFYDNFGMKKILISVDEKEILEKYYKKTLGKLEIFDHENNTDYLEFLRKYIDYDGSVQKLADEEFVHRNTINYKINKIKKILGVEINSLEEKFQIMMAFQIKDII